MHLLECVKHFFSVDNVIFVIAIDGNALTESICAVYGDGVNVDGYLRKFFDYHVELSAPSYDAFARLLLQSLRLHEIIQNRIDEWVEVFPRWCQAFKLPLRVQEQVLSHVNFVD